MGFRSDGRDVKVSTLETGLGLSRPLYDGLCLGLEGSGLGLGLKGSGLETRSQEGLKNLFT